MTEQPVPIEQEAGTAMDPRASLAAWANSSDEWVRLIVAEVIATGRPVSEAVVDQAYALFRQEKALDKRTLPAVEKLSTEARHDEAAPPMSIAKLSDVHGVNALVPGAVIELHEGLTILYGENGTGKTGYSRIFKSLADSRTADEILGNIDADGDEAQSAKIAYKLDGQETTLEWTGARGITPFTRMSIFDSPSVTTHVDEDLDYVYIPAALALFNHVVAGIQAVSTRIDGAATGLSAGGTTLVSRFQKGTTVYPLIETLGASTDLDVLKGMASADPKVDEKIDVLTQAVAALKSNTIGTQITARKREQRVLEQSRSDADILLAFNTSGFNDALANRKQLASDLDTFRTELFAAADLPAEPDDTWGAFIEAGDEYRKHLAELDVHDAERCLYCRQPLTGPASDLLSRYTTYLEDRISSDIRAVDAQLAEFRRQVSDVAN